MDISKKLFPGIKGVINEDLLPMDKLTYRPMGGTIFTYENEKYYYYGRNIDEEVLATPFSSTNKIVKLPPNAYHSKELTWEYRNKYEVRKDYPAYQKYIDRLNPEVEKYLLAVENLPYNDGKAISRLTNKISTDEYEDPTGIKKIPGYGNRKHDWDTI